jgi:hypothetical protein
MGTVYFLTYGTVLSVDNEGSINADLLLLWVFTTCGFWG